MRNLQKSFLVIGTGAVGGYYGGMLAKSGYDVTFVARGKNLEVLKEKGLTIIIENKRERFKVKAIEDVSEISSDKHFDYVLICTKSMDTRSVVEKFKSKISSDTTVLSFQNGIENEEVISEIVGKEKVVGSIVYVASQLIEPGIVWMTGNHKITIGELDRSKSKRVLEIQAIFQDAGVECLVHDDILAEMWNKLVWNAAFNSMSVVTGKTLDEMLKDSSILEKVKLIMNEVKNTAIACRVNIRPDTVEFNIARSYGYIGFKTSTLQDFERGKPIEVDAILGVVIKKAKEHNVSVPVCEEVYGRIKSTVLI